MQKHIVIVGGGAFGIELAWALEKKVDVTLIEQRSHFIHTPAMVRAVVTSLGTTQCFSAGDVADASDAMTISGVSRQLKWLKKDYYT